MNKNYSVTITETKWWSGLPYVSERAELFGDWNNLAKYVAEVHSEMRAEGKRSGADYNITVEGY